MNKKGQWKEEEMMKLLFYGFMVIVVAFIIILGFGLGLNTKFDVKDLEKNVNEYRLFNSPDCFGYTNDDGFFVRGVIDLVKFNEKRLSDCFNYPIGKMWGVKLILKDIEGNKIDDYEIELNSKLTTKRIECSVNKGNADGYKCYLDRKYVLYEDDGIKKGILDLVWVAEND